MKKNVLVKTLSNLLPAGIKVTEELLKKADDTLSSNDSIITYIRGNFKVERVAKPTAEAPHATKLVVCSGEPKAVLVAFLANDKLYIGWSKRNEETFLPKSEEVLKEFQALKGLDVVSAQLWPTLEGFLKKGPEKLKSLEAPFSKQVGRYIAYFCACSETLTFRGKRVLSARCGQLPDIVAKSLPRFIARAEKVAGIKAENVKYEG